MRPSRPPARLVTGGLIVAVNEACDVVGQVADAAEGRPFE